MFRCLRVALLSALILLCGCSAFAAKKHADATLLAPTPPLGWNSWDSYGLSVTTQEWEANVAWFHEHLEPAGWHYVVIDEGWYLQHPENAGGKGDQGYTVGPNGRYQPAPNRLAASPHSPTTPTPSAWASAFTSSAAFPKTRSRRICPSPTAAFMPLTPRIRPISAAGILTTTG
jgi:hypothetical protein